MQKCKYTRKRIDKRLQKCYNVCSPRNPSTYAYFDILGHKLVEAIWEQVPRSFIGSLEKMTNVPNTSKIILEKKRSHIESLLTPFFLFCYRTRQTERMKRFLRNWCRALTGEKL